MKRLFIEFAAATSALRKSGVSDEQIREVQRAIMRGEGDTIAGTGGLRKIRCGAAGRGKSGGVRIIFADYPDAGCTLWLFAFPKNVQGNITGADRERFRTLKRALDTAMKQKGNRP